MCTRARRPGPGLRASADRKLAGAVVGPRASARAHLTGFPHGRSEPRKRDLGRRYGKRLGECPMAGARPLGPMPEERAVDPRLGQRGSSTSGGTRTLAPGSRVWGSESLRRSSDAVGAYARTMYVPEGMPSKEYAPASSVKTPFVTVSPARISTCAPGTARSPDRTAPLTVPVEVAFVR